MSYKKLLENLDFKAPSETNFRRYSLSEIVSESYKACYESQEGSNLQKLAEAHLEDVRNNPTDIDRLSRQLCKIKSLARMVESKEIKDQELLVSEEEYDTIENKDTEDIKESTIQDEEIAEEESEDLEEDTELTDEEVAELTKHLESIRKNKKQGTQQSQSELQEAATGKVSQIGVDIYFPEEVDARQTENKIAKLLQDAGYEVVGCMFGDTSWSKEEYGMEESKSASEADPSPELQDKIMSKLVAAISSLGIDPDSVGEPLDELVYAVAKKVPVLPLLNKTDESRSYNAINLSEFTKKSAGKAFVKTFKKLDKKLHEGTALTRQESISLYKAANSAMTHLSVELEHNPEFLSTFTESAVLLSADVSKLLDSLKADKAPSKATMKSLARFSEALLNEAAKVSIASSDEDIKFIDDGAGFVGPGEVVTLALIKEYWNDNLEADPTLREYGSFDAWFEETKENYLKDYEDDLGESEETPTIEDEEEFEVVSSEESSEEIPADISEEEEEFLQDYADAYVEAREDIHDEMEEKYGDSEDPGVQDRLAQDADEVEMLKGEDEESEEEGVPQEEETESPEETKEEVTEESVEVNSQEEELEEEDDSDISDDELAELKKHLMEMRKAKSVKEALSPSWENIIKSLKADGYAVTGNDTENNLLQLERNGKQYVCKYKEDSKDHFIAGDPEIVRDVKESMKPRKLMRR